ncbi:MAG: chromate transporter [Acetobacteraceae bacterium]|nr:chromate transporter [Acetobacteraceae bacterium]
MLIAQIGLTSFGGGVSGWMMRVVVHERGWITESEFLTGLALCQVFPGINVLNLAIWLGYKLHGGAGALAGALAMLVPPGFVLIGLGIGFAHLANVPAIHAALTGVAAAAVGLTATMGLRAAHRAATGIAPIGLLGATFAAIALLHWPLVPVVFGFGVISVALAWREG